MNRSKEHRTSYLVTNTDQIFSCHGPDRQKIIDEEIRDGGCLLLTVDFPETATELEVQRFGDGVREGYRAAAERIRRALGFSR